MPLPELRKTELRAAAPPASLCSDVFTSREAWLFLLLITTLPCLLLMPHENEERNLHIRLKNNPSGPTQAGPLALAGQPV